MTTVLQSLIQIASGQGEVFDTVRDIIGQAELALLIAVAATKNTSIKISPSKVAEILDITPDGARKKIENTILKPSQGDSSSDSVRD